MFGEILNVLKFLIVNFMSGDVKGDNLFVFVGLYKFFILFLLIGFYFNIILCILYICELFFKICILNFI